MSMWDKLQAVERRFEEIGGLLSSPEIISNRELFMKYSREHKELTDVVEVYREYRKAKDELDGSKAIVDAAEDAELVDIAKEEIRQLQPRLAGLEEQLKLLLLPKDPNDEKNIIFEIRAGTGGNEAGIFAGDLFRMYSRYADARGWKMEILESSDGPAGGFKEIIAMVTGQGAYSRFKYEKGVHRVQRVPATEAQGRIHTSTITVAVLPEAEDVDIHIEEKDLRIDVYRSGGHGGQSVNTTDSAVRITHIPTGVVVAMQDEKSQHKNRDKAMRVLRARLLEMKQEQMDMERRDDRRNQVGGAERAEKIRTYNYPQSRITDHRIGLSVHSLAAVMNGDIDQVIEPLIHHYQTEALKAGSATEL